MQKYQYYVGLDLHKHYSYIVVKTYEGRKVKKGRVDNNEDALKAFFCDFSGKDVLVAIEATCNYYWMQQFLTTLGFTVKLAHPYKTRIIGEAKIKTDKIDADILADLLRSNMLPESYIPPVDIRDLRELIRHRIRLVQSRSAFKNQVHAILIKNNLSHTFTDVFGKQGKEWLNNLSLPDEYRYQLNQLLIVIDSIDQQIKLIEKRVRDLSIHHPIAHRFMQIDGISYFTALLLVAEIGDINRFRSHRQLVSFAGICPSVHSSGQTHYTAHITKQGNKYIRWALCESAQKAVRKNRQLGLFFNDIKKAKGYQKAIVATARKMLVGIYYVWQKNEPFAPVRRYKPVATAV